MTDTPEQRARAEIDRLLVAAGWSVQDLAKVDLRAAVGVAIREFGLTAGHGTADYLLYVEGKACGVIEAKKYGSTLAGVGVQSSRYAQGLPSTLPAWVRPLPFLYESTGIETRFTNGLDPQPRARAVFAFHRPEQLANWLKLLPTATVLSTGSGATSPEARASTPTFLARLQHMPELVTESSDFKLWPAQIQAVRNLEASLAANKPRALIQMATGSGKTFTAISFIYRLIKFAGARRVLFLVDRGNLGRQTKKEFDAYVSPYNNYKFGEEYIVQHLQGNTLDTTARVTISTIQRLFSMLRGRELADEDDERSTEATEGLFKDPEPIAYNPAFPIETFDIIVTDEAHRSIYNLWRQVLEYFDAHLIGLTATPNKQTFGFFNQNLVMEYGHAQAVADGVNVNYDVYRIRTEVSEQGSQVEAGYCLRMYNIEAGAIAWRDIKRMLLTAQEHEDYGLREGDLLVNRVNSRELVGKSAYVPASLEPSVFESKNIRVRLSRDRAEPKFINYQLLARGSRHFANNAQQVVGMASISQGQLADFPIVLAELDEQRRIVAEIEKQFSRLDESVANLRRVKANLRRYVARVRNDAAAGRLLPGNSGYAPNEDWLPTERSSSLGTTPLPAGWTWVTCGDVIDDIEAGASFKCQERPPLAGEVGVLKVSAVTWGSYDEDESKTCLDPSRIREDLMVRPGDLLFSRANTIDLVGACVIVGATVSKRLMLSDKTLRLRLSSKVAHGWMLNVLRSGFGRSEIERLATGNQESMRNIGQERIRQIRLPLPPLEEQHRIVAEVDRRLSIVRGVEAEVDANLKRAQALRQAVLAKAFAGDEHDR